MKVTLVELGDNQRQYSQCLPIIIYPSKACSNISFPMSLYTCSWLAKFGSSGCVCMRNTHSIAIQWEPLQFRYIPISREEIAHISEVSLWVTLQGLFGGKEKVFSFERCPHFRGVFREGFHCIYIMQLQLQTWMHVCYYIQTK